MIPNLVTTPSVSNHPYRAQPPSPFAILITHLSHLDSRSFDHSYFLHTHAFYSATSLPLHHFLPTQSILIPFTKFTLVQSSSFIPSHLFNLFIRLSLTTVISQPFHHYPILSSEYHSSPSSGYFNPSWLTFTSSTIQLCGFHPPLYPLQRKRYIQRG